MGIAHPFFLGFNQAPFQPDRGRRADATRLTRTPAMCMRFPPLFPLLLIAAGVSTPAYADIFKCRDAEGRITYTNDRTLGRNCERMPDQPVSTVPAPVRRASPADAATAAGFPRVTPQDQRSRDDTRRQVLDTELAREQAALEAARQTLAGEESRNAPAERLQPLRDKVELHQRNIDALRQELNGLR